MAGVFWGKLVQSLHHGLRVKDRKIALMVFNYPGQPTVEGLTNIHYVFIPLKYNFCTTIYGSRSDKEFKGLLSEKSCRLFRGLGNSGP